MYNHIGTEIRPEFYKEAAVGNLRQWAKAWSSDTQLVKKV